MIEPRCSDPWRPRLIADGQPTAFGDRFGTSSLDSSIADVSLEQTSTPDARMRMERGLLSFRMLSSRAMDLLCPELTCPFLAVWYVAEAWLAKMVGG